jgi:glycerophosphoryl diester phosphodiesterase
MRIFAHRGVFDDCPENTAPAFRAALRNGYSIETDLRCTKDYHVVISHDASTARTTGIDLLVEQSTLADLEELEYGRTADGPLRIMTLHELLDLYAATRTGDAVLALQIKTRGGDRTVADELLAYAKRDTDLYDNVFVFDLTLDEASRLRERMPSLKLSLALGETENFPDPRYPTIYTHTQLKDERLCDIIWGDEWESGLYNKELIAHYHARDVPFIAISPELHARTDPKHVNAGSIESITLLWRKLIAWGVDGICTDYPHELRKVLNEYSEK